MTDRKKQSLIAGGLTSSAGIFLSKALGIIYVVPFAAMATEANLTYYARAYSIYDTVLNISIAGLPFAIAALVAKYTVKDDYKTVVLIRKLSTAILLVFGFLAMAFLIIFALPIAQFTVAGAIDSVEVLRTRNVLIIISLAVFAVPFLSSFRGFYQGLKELKIYAFSQILEQVSRIAFLLGMGFLAVYVFNKDAIWAVYFAVASAAASAIISIGYFVFVDRKHYPSIKERAINQISPVKDTREVVKELFYFAIPYMITVILGNSMNIVNLLLFNHAMIWAGSTVAHADLLYSLIMFTCNKLTSIPQVLAPGFSIAVIPYITAAMERGDMKLMRKYVVDALDTVLYVGLPLCFFLFAISGEIYYVMYGSANWQLGGNVLAWSSLLAVVGTVAPVAGALMMVLRLRKSTIIILSIGAVIKAVTMVPLILWTGYSGAITSSVLTSIFIITADLYLISKNYKVKFSLTLRRLILISVGLLSMEAVFMILKLIGLNVIGEHRLLAFAELSVYGILGVAAYVITTWFMQLPQVLFQVSAASLKKRFKR